MRVSSLPRCSPSAKVGAQAPAAADFPAYPESWYLFAQSAAVRQKPLARNLLGRRLVAYRGAGGQVRIMEARCAHLGADLGQGCVAGEALRCPFHHWEYGPDGRCLHIPASTAIPVHARVRTYPVVERHGLLFFFNGPKPLFPLPFFEGCQPEDLVAAKPFGAVLDCPWFLVGANGFDLQHFRTAHDRKLIGEPIVDCPAPHARRAAGTFRIVGNSFLDRLTRRFAGDQVQMSNTDWCGNLMFTTATFRRTQSYGMISTCPLESGQVSVQVIVFVQRGSNRLLRAWLDPLRLWLRRFFIMMFLRADARLLSGIRYNRLGLIECDQHLVEYWRWLASLSARNAVHEGGNSFPQTDSCAWSAHDAI